MVAETRVVFQQSARASLPTDLLLLLALSILRVSVPVAAAVEGLHVLEGARAHH